MFGSRRRRVLVGVAAGLLMATAACSSSGGAQSAAPNSTEGKRLTIAMVTHAPPGDAFWAQIQKGAEDAAAKDNVELKYSSSIEIPQQTTFIQNAIDSKVDGIAVTLPNPDALGPVVQKAIAAGIPVVAINAGDRAWQKTGALAFFGEPEVLAGEFAGTELNKIGAKHALCVVQAQGQVQLEDRCQGMSSKFSGTSDKLYADGTDTPSYVSLVTAKLRQDPSIDAVVTLGPALGVAVQQELEKQGSTAKVATYAFNKDLIPLLANGKIAFTIDQQPYLQGYMGVDSLWLYAKNHSVIGSQQSVATGPVVVDKSNIGDLTKYISEGLR
jgi:simple sugar transport system substrate-binding protein